MNKKIDYVYNHNNEWDCLERDIMNQLVEWKDLEDRKPTFINWSKEV